MKRKLLYLLQRYRLFYVILSSNTRYLSKFIKEKPGATIDYTTNLEWALTYSEGDCYWRAIGTLNYLEKKVIDKFYLDEVKSKQRNKIINKILNEK